MTIKQANCNKAIKNILLFILLSLVHVLRSNAQDLIFKSLTVNDGLSQHGATSIMQDSYGYIWIGTNDGLNKFNGHEIISFYHNQKNKNTISGNRIFSLFEDSKRRLWIGTEGNGLNYFSQETNQIFRIKVPEKHKVIRCIIETENKNILIGTGGGLLKIINHKKNEFEIIEIKSPKTAIHSMVERNGVVYFTTHLGVWKLVDENIKRIESITSDSYRAITIDKIGNIWTGTWRKNILYKIDQNEKITSYQLPDNTQITSICNSKDNNIWIGTLIHGLFQFDKKTNKIRQNIIRDPLDIRSLSDNTVIRLFCDASNVLWIGTRNGISYTNLSKKNIKAIPLQKNIEGLKNHQIRSLLIDDKDLYVGFQNQGVYKISMDDNYKSVKINAIGVNYITKIQDTIYLATNKDLFTLKNNKIQLNSIKKNNYLSICADKFGNIYAGTYGKLLIKESKANTYKSVEAIYPNLSFLQDKLYYSLKYDEDLNCIWAGTLANGLYKLNLNNKGYIKNTEHYHSSYNNDYYIQNDAIWDIYKDNKTGTIWAGTNSGLVYKKSNDKKFNPVKNKALFNANIISIQIDKNNNLWLGNSKGLIHYNPTTNNTKTFTYHDGFQSSAFTEASTQAQDGTLFFGSINGINYFNPKDLLSSNYVPSIMFDEFEVYNQYVYPKKEIQGSVILNKNINLTSKIILNHKQNNFKLNFSSTSYINPTDVSYRYQMVGYDTKPITVNGKQNFAAYSNLPKGTYTFWIQVANKDGLWNPNKKTIEFKILPPFWQSTFAYVLYSLLTILFLTAVYYFFYNRQRLRYQKESNEIKLDYFTDIAHEFKTPLSLIIGPVNNLLNNNISKEQRDFFYNVMARNTKRMSFLVNQLLDFRKINAGINILKINKQDLSAFVKETSEAFAWQQKSNNINFNINVPKQFECYFDRDILEKALYNLLSNAFKFTPQNGNIDIDIEKINKKEKKLAVIKINDSGKGIPDEEKLKIFDRFHHGRTRASSGIGLNLTYNLIKAHKGNITVTGSSYGGTLFTITIPVNKTAYSQSEFFKAEDEYKANEILDFKTTDINLPIKPEKAERVLIVEDDSELRAYLKHCLQSIYFVSEAKNGLEGLQEAEKEIPDIIISDVMMPEMGGIEFCQLLKNNNQTSHIPVLILTAKTDDEYRKEGLKAGAWDYITKPFDANNLLQKIDNILKAINNHKSYLLKQNLSVLLKENYTSHDKKFITNFTKMVLKNMAIEDYTIDDYATEIGVSRMQLHRKIKQITGLSTTKLINTIRINYAAEMFHNGCDNVKEAMHATGFNNYVHFNRTFKDIKNTFPKKYIESV